MAIHTASSATDYQAIMTGSDTELRPITRPFSEIEL